jgi:hypothetical protein
MKPSILAVCLLILSITSYGQTLPLGAIPMEYNSSFAGQAGALRISSNLFYYYEQASYNPSTITRQHTGFIFKYLEKI